jgi:hypothetical protein
MSPETNHMSKSLIVSSHGSRGGSKGGGIGGKQKGAIYHTGKRVLAGDSRAHGKAWESVSMSTYKVTPSQTRYQHMDDVYGSVLTHGATHGAYNDTASLGSGIFSEYTMSTTAGTVVGNSSLATASSASIQKLRKDFFRS